MSEFMEVFTVTHMTYVCIFPVFVAVLGLVFAATGEILSLKGDNIFLIAFLALILLLSGGKAFETMKEAPYFMTRMEQFEGIDNKLN